ncbi:MAG: phosphoribosyltransferase family protein, partial [Deltaproteobacteria bacterium]|nr:phosphoribosyltransferase family protein [Deltaproteobacteria bacterium]
SPYTGRLEAGKSLAAELDGYAEKRPVVVGLPRGGVVVAAEIARALKCEMDIIIAGKLRAPYNPELAIGAVTEDGLIYLNEPVIRSMRIDPEYLEREKKARIKAIQDRLTLYRKIKKKVALRGRTVIIADDGLATGATMISAIQAVRAEGARKIIIAVPGGPQDTVDRICRMEEVDKVVCPVIPPLFFAVSQLYQFFNQVEDEEVTEILKEFA